MAHINKYYDFFRDSIGKGGGKYYTGIGQIYKKRSGLLRGYGTFVPGVGVSGRTRGGLGIGSFFKSLFRVATPMMKSFGKKAAETSLDLATGVAKDLLEGKNIRDSITEHASNIVHNTSEHIKRKLKNPEAFSGVIRNNIDETNRSTAPAASAQRQQSRKRKPKKIKYPVYGKKSKQYPALKLL